MQIKLVLWEDASMYDIEDINSLCWTLEVGGKEIGELHTITELHKMLNVVFDIEDNFYLIEKEKNGAE